jgi:hypothetical protein
VPTFPQAFPHAQGLHLDDVIVKDLLLRDRKKVVHVITHSAGVGSLRFAIFIDMVTRALSGPTCNLLACIQMLLSG